MLTSWNMHGYTGHYDNRFRLVGTLLQFGGVHGGCPGGCSGFQDLTGKRALFSIYMFSLISGKSIYYVFSSRSNAV